MSFQLSEYLVLFVASLSAVGLLTPVVREFAIRLNVVDSPSESHKTHKQPVPYLGGVAIVLGVCIVTYAAILQTEQKNAIALASTVLIPAILLGIIGLIDDVRKLQPWPRFIAQNLVGLVIAGILIRTDTIGSPSSNIFLDFFITIFWIVGITNSINFFDNVDGGASGAIAISSFFLFLLSFQGGQYSIAGLAIVLAGATFGFLLWNRPPARIYMGDAGALFLGVLIATLSLRFDPNPIFLSASFSIPVLLLAVPILDTSVAVISRLRRKISPFQGGQDHLSHRLMRTGMNKKQAVLSLWLISIFFCCVAVGISNAPYTLERLLALAGALIWTILLITFLNTDDS
jgi:UDP-GlcNAc:undecaprenyl-phosphate/decaprenyl-phosphate GlcNAc-1-phosphate transferase